MNLLKERNVVSELNLNKSLLLGRAGVYVVNGVAPEHAIDALHFFQSCSGSLANKIDSLAPGKGNYAFRGFDKFDKKLWEELDWLFGMCENAGLKFLFYMTETEITGMATYAPQLFKARLGTYDEYYLPPSNCSMLGEWRS